MNFTLNKSVYFAVVIIHSIGTASAQKIISSNDTHIRVYDFHTHLYSDTEDLKHIANYRRSLETKKMARSFRKEYRPFLPLKISRSGSLLITPTYNRIFGENPLVDKTDRYTSEFDRITERVSGMIQESNSHSRSQIRGLCGLILGIPNLIEKAEMCLNLPGMVGIKLRLEGDAEDVDQYSQLLAPGNIEAVDRFLQTSRPDDHFKKDFTKLAELIHRKKGVMLIHFHSQFSQHKSIFPDSAGKDEAEVLLNTAKAYPDARFVIAHAGATMIEAKEFSLFTNQKNIYLETSGAFTVNGVGVFISQFPKLLASERSLNIVQAWRALGIERVLFGSDDDGNDDGVVIENIYSIVHNPHLSDSEKEMILYKNGERLWK